MNGRRAPSQPLASPPAVPQNMSPQMPNVAPPNVTNMGQQSMNQTSQFQVWLTCNEVLVNQAFLFYLCFKLYTHDCFVMFYHRLYLQNYQSYETGMPMMNSSMPQHLSVLENDYHIPTSNQSYPPQLASPSHQPITSPLHHMSPEQSHLQNYTYNQTQQQVLIAWLLPSLNCFHIMLLGDIFDRVGKSVTLTVLSFTSVLTQWLQHTWKLIYFSNMCIKTAFSISHKWINYIIHTYFRNTESTWKMNKPKDYSAVGIAVAYYKRLMVC